MKKWLGLMSDEKKEPRHPAHSDDSKRDGWGRPETNFLPPLKMFLAFFDRESRQNKKKKNSEQQENTDEKNVEKLIEKLSEEDK